MKKYFIKTFWCEMNKADSEKINMILLQSWFVKTNLFKEALVVILNTCSVRQKWEDRVFGLMQEIFLENQKRNKKIITWITGCMVRKTGINSKYLSKTKKRQTAKKIEYINDKKWIFNNDDKLFPRLKNLDFTFRIEEIKYIPHILTHIIWENIWNDSSFDDYLKINQFRENPFSASVIIQTWCDNYCNFCIVPYTRGKEISRPQDEIKGEIKKISDSWIKEITLVGQNVNSYWKQFLDKKFWNNIKSKWNDWIWISPFRKLLDEVNKIDWIDRIRFTSSNPHDMTFDILDAHFELDKVCNYLHFALQSWNDEVLKRMNRKHTYNDFKKMVNYLRSKDPIFSISTDIIVWYSWETNKEFEDTKKALIELEIDFVYIARYSVRDWTIASKIYKDDIWDDIKAERWHELNEILKQNVKKRWELMIGRKEKILISWEKDWKFFGRTRNFKEVFILKNNKKLQIWDLVLVKITWLDEWVLLWEIE